MQDLSSGKPGKNWLLKYKLHHIPFWILYNYIWWTVAVGNPVKAADAIFHAPFAVKFSFYVIFPALAVYFNLYFLIPRYLETRRFSTYIGYLLITLFITSILIIPGYYLSAYMGHTTAAAMWGGGTSCFFQFWGNALPPTVASMTLAMSIKLTKNWIQTQTRQQLLEKEKLETELKFLKNQFNPHFLFNTINSIFFLIHKNPHMASASLAKFSELLRYQLYECNDKQIPLSNEIAYLENFIELERLRQNNNTEIGWRMNQPDTGHVWIAPFILMTFVENAFKHVSKDTDKPSWIRIVLNLDGSAMDFSVSNSISCYALNEVVHYGGIGLKNVQRRLDLIYPGKYDLDIQRTGESFEVRLRLDLAALALTQSMPGTALAI